MIYVVRHNTYVHGQRLQDNFTNNETLQKSKNSQKTKYPIHPNFLAPKEFLYQNSLGNLTNLDAQTNEELPYIYKKHGVHYCTNPNKIVNKN